MDILSVIAPIAIIIGVGGLGINVVRMLNEHAKAAKEADEAFGVYLYRGFGGLLREGAFAVLWILALVLAIEGRTVVLVSIYPDELLSVSDADSGALPYVLWPVVATGLTLSYLVSVARLVVDLGKVVRRRLAPQRAK